MPQTQEQIKWDADVGPISALSVDDKHIEERVLVDQYSEHSYRRVMTVMCPTCHLFYVLRRKAHVLLSTNVTTGKSKSLL